MLHLSCVNFKKGTCLFFNGAECNDRFYIIQSGSVECETVFDRKIHKRMVLSQGDFIGVVSCLASRRHFEDCIALTDVKCIAVQKEQYADLIKKNIPVARKVICTFAGRMHELCRWLSSLDAQKKIQCMAEHIFEVACYYDAKGKWDAASSAYHQYIKECSNGLHIEEAKERFHWLKHIATPVHLAPAPLGVRDYPAGSLIMCEGQGGEEMFFIQEGQVTLSRIEGGREIVRAILKKGDMFGEMALLEKNVRSTNAIAHTDCSLLVLSWRNFDKMVLAKPHLISRLTEMIADRVWALYRQLWNATMPIGLGKILDMLALQLEKFRRMDGSFQTDYSIDDIISLCSIPPPLREKMAADFQNERYIKMNKNMIYVEDCAAVIKTAGFLRKESGTEKYKKERGME